jgi:hypothetical protein
MYDCTYCTHHGAHNKMVNFANSVVKSISLKGQSLFPTRLLTSEDECKWYWHQMIYFPGTIDTISTTITSSPIHSLVPSWVMYINLLCQAGITKPCGGRHPWPLVVFSLPLSGLNWRSLLSPRGSSPSFPNMAAPFTGSAHTPLPGSGTLPANGLLSCMELHQSLNLLAMQSCTNQ